MALICPDCREFVEPGRPLDACFPMPADRKRYRHKKGWDALCPVVGTDATGKSSYVPALPVKK